MIDGSQSINCVMEGWVRGIHLLQWSENRGFICYQSPLPHIDLLIQHLIHIQSLITWILIIFTKLSFYITTFHTITLQYSFTFTNKTLSKRVWKRSLVVTMSQKSTFYSDNFLFRYQTGMTSSFCLQGYSLSR